jgi:RNase H-fold protein (predicted Holliday junction resolvase)
MPKSKSESYILTLPLKTSISDISALDKYFELSRKLYNALLGESLKRLDLMRESKQYQEARASKSKDKNKLFNEVCKRFKFTEYDIIVFSTPLRVNEFSQIDSNTVQKLASRAYNAVFKMQIGKADRVNFKRYDEMDSIEGASNRQGIKFREDLLSWNKLKIPIMLKPNDIYARQALQDRIKYCRIQRKLIRGKTKYYIQLILEGIPPQKYNKETSEIKNPKNDGVVGIDIGTQTIAYASNDEVKLLELAPEVNNIEKYKRKLQRKLDRQRRANNPNKYNEDGTIILNRDKWIWSKNYLKTKNELAEIQRKIANIRKQSHEKLANHILSLGNEVKVEKMNFQGLQKRAKKTTVNEKTGRINKKKRFGKSLANKAPSMLLSIIDRKLKYQGLNLLKVDTFQVKASQYNHFTGECVKKSLSERWNDFEGMMIQRDLYSAFLIMNVEKDVIDRNKCFSGWDNFKAKYDIEIGRIENCDSKLISSMGM